MLVVFIGILGGMGPQATAEFYSRLIKTLQQKCGCKDDSDYPEIIIYNLPLSFVVGDDYNEKQLINELVAGVNKLASWGANFVVIPCNTANVLIYSQKTDVPVLNILGILPETSESITILGTAITAEKYRQLYESKGVYVKTPDQTKIDQIINQVLAGNYDNKELMSIVDNCTNGQIILACTELPLICDYRNNVIDTMDLLVKATVIEACRLGKADSADYIHCSS